jgi:hypothetical protein
MAVVGAKSLNGWMMRPPVSGVVTATGRPAFVTLIKSCRIELRGAEQLPATGRERVAMAVSETSALLHAPGMTSSAANGGKVVDRPDGKRNVRVI